MPESPFSPAILGGNAQTASLTLHATRNAAAASLAGGMIAATGRPHSLEEALAVYNAAYFAMFPSEGNGRYEAWKAEEDRLTKVYK
jgi:hypothetical protein